MSTDKMTRKRERWGGGVRVTNVYKGYAKKLKVKNN